jgi:hypothetical protein
VVSARSAIVVATLLAYGARDDMRLVRKMKMTKVILSKSLLEYRREMAEIVRQSVKESFIGGVKAFHSGEPFLAHPDLLPPPKIEIIELTTYKGQIGDPIFLATSDDFGIWNVHMVVRDDKGNLIESGDAASFEDGSGCWDYMATASVPSGTSVTIYAAATDSLGGVGALSQSTTVP